MSIRKIVFKSAMKIYLAIVGFYFLVKLLGLAHIIELRFINILFVILGVNSAIKSNRLVRLDTRYISNLLIGFETSFLAVLTVLVSMTFYVSYIDDSLLMMLQKSSYWGNNLTLPKIVFSMTIEALASCFISSFTLMQYWKKITIENYKF